jgi:hypothetical protein
MDGNKIPVEGGWLRGQVAAATAATSAAAVMLDMKSAFAASA